MGHITTDTTFTGTVDIAAETTIDPGVTVIAAPGTTINFGPAGKLVIKGTFDVQGTSAAKVTLGPATAGGKHGGLNVASTGTLKMAYGVQTAGGVHLEGGGTITITDSSFTSPGAPDTNGDFFTSFGTGGSLTMSYSEIGLATGDGTHCNMHFGATGNALNVTKTTIRGVTYGIMFYAGSNAIFTENNWETINNVDPAPSVSGDFSGSYFMGAAPTVNQNGATLTLNNLAAAPIADARPR